MLEKSHFVQLYGFFFFYPTRQKNEQNSADLLSLSFSLSLTHSLYPSFSLLDTANFLLMTAHSGGVVSVESLDMIIISVGSDFN